MSLRVSCSVVARAQANAPRQHQHQHQHQRQQLLVSSTVLKFGSSDALFPKALRLSLPLRPKQQKNCSISASSSIVQESANSLVINKETEDLHRQAYNDAFAFFNVRCPSSPSDGPLHWDLEVYGALHNRIGGRKLTLQWYFKEHGWPTSTLFETPPKKDDDRSKLIDILQDWQTERYQEIIKSGSLITNYAHEDYLIGFDAMLQANDTIEEFCISYLVFHGMDVTRPQSLFKYLPVLSYFDGFVYKLDTLNEKMWNRSIVQDGKYDKLGKVFESEPFGPLMLQLQNHGLLTERIREELRCGVEYWALERRLCSDASEQVSIEEIIRAVYYKAFDFRVMSLLLYKLRGEEVNELHMEILTVGEFLGEIADDLSDYKEDVLGNTFNIMRMFVRIYGASAAPTMLDKYIIEAEEKYVKLSKALDPHLSLSCLRRFEEASKIRGKVSPYSLGSWTMPTIIEDEELYRASMQDAS